MDQSSDEDLMVRYQQGDRRAFEALFARLAPRVHGFFLRALGDATTADDLLQTTFLKVHRARAEYRPGLRVRPWLFTIAARVRLDELRRRRRLPEDSDEEALARAEEEAGEKLQQTPPADPNVVERVRAALGRLPESQRVVVQLHRYEELTFTEIGAVLGISAGAVKLRAFRAYEQLRRELGDLWAEEKVA